MVLANPIYGSYTIVLNCIISNAAVLGAVLSGRKHMSRVGQNRRYAPYMTVYLVKSLPKIPYMHRIYMVLANPTHQGGTNVTAHTGIQFLTLYTIPYLVYNSLSCT